MNINIKRKIYDQISSILSSANDIDNSDDDEYCQDCEDDDEHSSDYCECFCHDGSSYFEYCASKITEYIISNYELVDKNEKQ